MGGWLSGGRWVHGYGSSLGSNPYISKKNTKMAIQAKEWSTRKINKFKRYRTPFRCLSSPTIVLTKIVGPTVTRRKVKFPSPHRVPPEQRSTTGKYIPYESGVITCFAPAVFNTSGIFP
jgi:hypothetical protein